MSSPSVCHRLQPCLYPLQANTEDIKPRIHEWLRTAWVSPDHPNSVVRRNRGNSHEWNSVNLLFNPVQDSATPPPTTYAKQTLHTSCNLDMCTETLGCETGAMCSSYELDLEVAALTRTKMSPALRMEARKQRSASPPEFPPPLTTLRGEGRLRLRRKLEEGRLLLIPFKPFLLESERSNGRLILRFLPSGAAKEIEEEREVEEEEEEFVDKDENGVEEMGCFVYRSGGKYRRSGRCKEEEGGKKMSAAAIFNCDSFWVASS